MLGALTADDSRSISQAAVTAAGKSLAVDLNLVALSHLGFVGTDMTGHQGLIDADESVLGLLARMDELTLELSGSFRHQDGETLPW